MIVEIIVHAFFDLRKIIGSRFSLEQPRKIRFFPLKRRAGG